MRKAWLIIALAMVLAFPAVVLAQQPTTGTLQGVVGDRDGKPLPGATVVVSGPLGERGVQTDENGNFTVPFLPPGTYKVKVSMPGYATIETEVDVNAGQRTRLPITLTTGKTEEVTVTSAAPLVDPKRLEVINNFKAAETIETMPVGRNFTSVVAIAPGVVSGLGTGAGNYSIGGASGLENSYMIDGVNITDSGYGGVGTYSLVFGSLGTGITTDFLEEVQVKTAGFEAEYGQALGGVINAVVKSGTNELKGSVRVFLDPDSWEAWGKDVHLPSGAVNVHDHKTTDLGISAGGPIIKDKLFWFAAYNPVSTTSTRYIEKVTNPIVAYEPATAATYPDELFYPGARSSRDIDRDRDNYAAKFSWYVTPNHRLDLTLFGDPSDGDGRSGITAGTFVMDGDTDGDGVLDMQKTAAGFNQNGRRSDIDYGADQQSLKYNGLFGGEWFVEAQVSHRKNDFKEKPLVNDYAYSDIRVYYEWLIPAYYGLPATIDSGAPMYSGGPGYIGPKTDETWDYALKVSKTWGDHEVKFGYEYFDLEYEQPSIYSGPNTIFNFPGENYASDPTDVIPLRSTSGASISVRGGIPTCATCMISAGNPYYRVTRARFNPEPGPVKGYEQAFFVQDTWTLNDKWVVKLGVRTSKQKLEGAGSFTMNLSRSTAVPGTFTSDPTHFSPSEYSFDTEYSPRIGVSFDPYGNGKTKIYAHYGRYYERVPADLAVRSFSNEFGTSKFEFTDPLLTNYRGTPIYLQGFSKTRVQSGTKLPYEDEYVLGWQQLLAPDLSVEIRGIYRDQGRVLEDVQFNTVEAIENYYYGVDANGDGTLNDNITEIPFPGMGFATFGEYVLANPGDNTGSAFGSPERKYKALEIVVQKRLSNNWQLTANYRYSRLRGNYEGLFRNDNGQSDPNITSLFDFPYSPIMRGQYQSGPLNTDRPHVLHILGTYFFDNGFEIGGGFHWQSGVPRTPLLAHPNYQNGGELPGQDPRYFVYDGTQWVLQPGSGDFLGAYTDAPRGSLGRTPDIGTLDLHLGYKHQIKNTNLKVTLDIFNIFNNQEVALLDDEVEYIANVPNANFNRVLAYQAPRFIRLGVVWDW